MKKIILLFLAAIAIQSLTHGKPSLEVKVDRVIKMNSGLIAIVVNYSGNINPKTQLVLTGYDANKNLDLTENYFINGKDITNNKLRTTRHIKNKRGHAVFFIKENKNQPLKFVKAYAWNEKIGSPVFSKIKEL